MGLVNPLYLTFVHFLSRCTVLQGYNDMDIFSRWKEQISMDFPAQHGETHTDTRVSFKKHCGIESYRKL